MFCACLTWACAATEGTNPPAQLISFVAGHHVKAYSWKQILPWYKWKKPSLPFKWTCREHSSVKWAGPVHQLQDFFHKLEPMVTCSSFEAGVPTFHRGKILLISCLQSLFYFRALNSVRVATAYKPMPVTLPKLFFHKKQELSAIWMSLTCDISKGLKSFSTRLIPHHNKNTKLNPLCLWQTQTTEPKLNSEPCKCPPGT